MNEFDRETMEHMCDVIEDALAHGTCENGDKLGKDEFEAMFLLASGVKHDKI